MVLNRTKILNGIYLPDHLVMSAQECIQLYDALECVLGREKSSSLEPSVILGERFLKKKDVLEYVETLKRFICNLILEGQAGLEMFERIKTELTSTDCHFDDGLLHNEGRFLKSNNDKLLSYMMKENMFPAIVFVFNRSYCSRHRGLKLDGAIGQGEICNSLKSENFSKSFLSHIGKNEIKF